MPSRPLELWGGTECTVNRVGNTYYDQIERTGHGVREDDLDRFADLGLRTLRYPVLWERTEPGDPELANWTWADRRLDRLQELGVRPVVGLVHHGSGPSHTGLLDPDWARGLAAFAERAVRRYPWVTAWTPVNEPLTTARFSGLYGHWYPHAADDRSFAQALMHQMRGVVLAMRAIRAVRPDALLVQTEDLAFVHSTPTLAYQADFENERRWLTFDLLCGRMQRGHPLYDWLLRCGGVSERDLAWFAEHPTPPDLMGLNYYVVSERYLDDDPGVTVGRGGNGRHCYADRDAVRSCGLAGVAVLLQQAWARFRLPLAVTEAHLAGWRDEQLRWLLDVWDGALAAREGGADVRAVTVWSLLGAYDWDSLCTRGCGRYEPGVFDVTAPRPRPTALAGAVRALTSGSRPQHPVLASRGWWCRATP